MTLLHSSGHSGSAIPNRNFLSRPFLVVDWMTTGVVLSQATVSGKVPSLLSSQFHAWPEGLDPLMNPEQAGTWLRSVCDKAGLSSNAVAISVPRRDLSIKLLELPTVSDDELGPLVALQVESRFQATNQPVVWDCLAHPATSADNCRHVVLISMPASLLTAIQSAARVAGWTNLIVTSGDVSIGLAHAAANSGWQMHVQASSVKLELTLCRDGLLVSSSATAMPHGSPVEAAAFVQSIIARMLAAVPSAWQPPASELRVVICGTRAQSLADALKQSGVNSTVWCDDDRTPRAIAVAQSLIHSHSRIDFLRPRSADRRSLQRRQRRIMACIVAAIMCLSVLAGSYMLQQSHHQELARLESERQQLQQYVDRGQAAVDKWTYLSRWQRSTVNSATEIRDLAKLLPERDRLIVTRLQLENLVDAEDSVLRIDGLAQDSAEVLAMNGSIIRHADRYELRPQGIEPSPEGSEFPSQFRIEVLLRNQQSAQEPVR